MKKLLIAAGLGLSLMASAQAADKIAVVDMENVFQQVAQKNGLQQKIESEFKSRDSALQREGSSLQSKMQRLQQNGSSMKASERDAILKQRDDFAAKVQALRQDQARRVNEERGKLASRIQSAVQSVARDKSIDVVLDSNTVAYTSNDVSNITSDVLKKVR